MKIFTILIAFFIGLNLCTAQKTVTVKGLVLETGTNVPLEYATITFINPTTKAIVSGDVTNTKGLFKIDVVPGVYDISVEYISFKTKTYLNKEISDNINLGTVALELDMASLGQVTIVAERTTVEIKLDKKVYNIGSDLSTAGGTVSDALNNVPSVSVDIEGAISLRGNENVRILINGKPSALAGFGDSNVLGQLPADAIERVEVITSPSARYDAEGTAGILNIILRQKETLGFNGTVNFNAGYPDNLGLNASLNYRKEKFNLFTTLGWRYNDSPRTRFNDVTYFDQIVNGQTEIPEYRRIVEDNNSNRLRRNYNANIGIEYFLTDKSSITAGLFYRIGNDVDTAINNSERYNNNTIVEETLRRERETELDNSYQLSLNYITQFGKDTDHKLTVDLQYEAGGEDGFTFLNEDYVTTNQTNPEPFQIEQEFTVEDETEFLLQADYVLPIGENSRFEAGFRSNLENNLTDYRLEQEDIMTGNLIVNDTITNVFDYDENVNSVYSQYGSKLGKFSFLLGLRLEHTQLKGDIDSPLTDTELVQAFGFPIQTKFDNNYLGLFPTVNLIYDLKQNDDDDEESITLGYNRRINRPRGRFINPFPSRSSRTNIFQGNPNLQPAFSSAFDVGYLKRWDKLTLTTSVYYQYETDSFERVQENTGQQTTDGIDIIRTIPINLSTNKRTGAELGILYNPNKWLRLNTSFNFFQFDTEGDFNGIDYSTKNTSYFARFSSKVTLPGEIDWQTNANYRGAAQDAQSDTEGLFTMDLAFSKELLENKLTLSANIRDVFNSRRRQSTTTTEFFERYSESQWRPRQFNLSLLYRFNQQLNKKGRGDRGGNDNGGDDFDFEG